MKLSPKRIGELERLLRRLRERAFDSDRACDLIPVVKRRLAETWQDRVTRNTQRHWMYACE